VGPSSGLAAVGPAACAGVRGWRPWPRTYRTRPSTLADEKIRRVARGRGTRRAQDETETIGEEKLALSGRARRTQSTVAVAMAMAVVAVVAAAAAAAAAAAVVAAAAAVAAVAAAAAAAAATAVARRGGSRRTAELRAR
jgi:hypothetical protein